MNVQEVMIVSTNKEDLRDAIVGWTQEDPSLFIPNKHIGFIRSPPYEHPETILEALYHGWKLLAPPSQDSDGYWSWWLVREKER